MREFRNVRTPVFVPTEDGAAAVVRAARRRRLRQASVGVATTLVVLGGSIGYTMSNQASGNTDRLDVTNGGQHHRPASERVLVPTRAGHPIPAASAHSSSHPNPGLPAPPSSVGAVGGGTAQPPVVTRPRPSPASPPATHWRAPHRVSPITHSSGRIRATDVCRDDATDAGSGWCVRYTGPASAVRGNNVTLSGEVCRLTAFSAATIRFSTTREIDLEVNDTSNGADVKLWKAGEGVHYRSPGRSVTVSPGSCLVWRSAWDTRDERGFVVPPGDYNVGFSIASNLFLSGIGTSITVTD